MELYDPTVTRIERDYKRAPALESLQGKTIALLSNGKLNADEFLSATAALFAQQHDCTVLPIFYKSNASGPAPSSTLAEMAEAADFMLTANGD
jgi:hypothetical protein